jgi:hypothetical protein
VAYIETGEAVRLDLNLDSSGDIAVIKAEAE